MLVYLIDYLIRLDVPGMGAFQYISTRSALAFVTAILLSTLVGRNIINRLQIMQMGEIIRPLDLEGQTQKSGTPTMGGIIIIISLLVPVLLFCKLNNIYILLLIVSTLLMGILGFADDYMKKLKQNKDGIKGKYKVIAQIFLGAIVAVVLFMSPAVVIKENSEIVNLEGQRKVVFTQVEHKSTKTTIPFVKSNNFDYSWLAKGVKSNREMLTFVIFFLACTFIVTAVSNGSNLTDGLDGLAAGSSAIVGVALGILAYISSHIEIAGYLNIMFIPGTEELVIFAAAFVGATLGFLWYNAYPAQVFMGDTGSLTLGGIIAVYALVLRKELLLPILCGIFLVEALSVTIQTLYFKYTRRKSGSGKRIFKMTPLHHHFQKPGDGSINSFIQAPKNVVPEAKIVTRFLLIGTILAALSILTLKLR